MGLDLSKSEGQHVTNRGGPQTLRGRQRPQPLTAGSRVGRFPDVSLGPRWTSRTRTRTLGFVMLGKSLLCASDF